MKHSKKLAFAVLAAVTAVGANVNPVDAAVRKSTAFVKNKKRKHCKINVSASYMRAADGNRTRDLRTTNATLYRLSHSSIT